MSRPTRVQSRPSPLGSVRARLWIIRIATIASIRAAIEPLSLGIWLREHGRLREHRS